MWMQPHTLWGSVAVLGVTDGQNLPVFWLARWMPCCCTYLMHVRLCSHQHIKVCSVPSSCCCNNTVGRWWCCHDVSKKLKKSCLQLLVPLMTLSKWCCISGRIHSFIHSNDVQCSCSLTVLATASRLSDWWVRSLIHSLGDWLNWVTECSCCYYWWCCRFVLLIVEAFSCTLCLKIVSLHSKMCRSQNLRWLW